MGDTEKYSKLLASGAAVVVVGASPVFAADAVPADAPPPSVANDPGGIIVTARRVEERLQDVPISITAFDNRRIANRNIDNPNDLTLYTPSLSTTGVLGAANTS